MKFVVNLLLLKPMKYLGVELHLRDTYGSEVITSNAVYSVSSSRVKRARILISWFIQMPTNEAKMIRELFFANDEVLQRMVFCTRNDCVKG